MHILQRRAAFLLSFLSHGWQSCCSFLPSSNFEICRPLPQFFSQILQILLNKLLDTAICFTQISFSSKYPLSAYYVSFNDVKVLYRSCDCSRTSSILICESSETLAVSSDSSDNCCTTNSSRRTPSTALKLHSFTITGTKHI